MNKEPKVYVIDICKNTDDLDFSNKEMVMTKAEEEGSVYSLQGFESAINSEELFLDNSYIYISNKTEYSLRYNKIISNK